MVKRRLQEGLKDTTSRKPGVVCRRPRHDLPDLDLGGLAQGDLAQDLQCEKNSMFSDFSWDSPRSFYQNLCQNGR